MRLLPLRAFPNGAFILQSTSFRLQVIVPCYNPPEGWEAALASKFLDFQKFIDQPGARAGLIVVNDGSQRNTSDANFEALRRLVPEAQIVSYAENRGKGYALRQGVAASDADFCLVTDADFPYTLDSMQRVVDTLRDKGGIAAGNRDQGYYDRVPPFRRRLSKSLRWLLRNVLRQPIDDSQCGLKGFDASGKAVFLETTIDRFLFDLEFLMLANGRVPVTPVPVELRPGITFSKMGSKILLTEGGNFMKLFFKNMLHLKK